MINMGHKPQHPGAMGVLLMRDKVCLQDIHDSEILPKFNKICIFLDQIVQIMKKDHTSAALKNVRHTLLLMVLANLKMLYSKGYTKD